MILSNKHLLSFFFLFMGLSLQAHPWLYPSLKVDTKKTEKKTPRDTTSTAKDSVDVKKKVKKKNEYADLLKKGGTELKGLFTVRHIEDKWYFEVPDSLLGRYFLAVTRLTATPQNFFQE